MPLRSSVLASASITPKFAYEGFANGLRGVFAMRGLLSHQPSLGDLVRSILSFNFGPQELYIEGLKCARKV